MHNPTKKVIQIKDAFYFSHDSNSKDDPKCVMLIEQLGLEGYGIFWVLIETLRDQPDYRYPLSLIPALARRYNSTAQKVEAVIKGYGLFQFTEDDFFFSKSLIERMRKLEDKRESQRQKALKRWNNDATALPQQCHGNADAMPVKESKVNKSKVKESKEDNISSLGDKPQTTKFIPPTVNEVKSYCKERNNTVDAEKFVNHYAASNWFRNKTKIKDWKACVRTWEKNEKDKPAATYQTRKPTQSTNFEQRQYDDEYFDNFFLNNQKNKTERTENK